MTKTEYYIKQADLAHELYNKLGGGHADIWLGAARGFGTRISNKSLFDECLEKAKVTLSK